MVVKSDIITGGAFRSQLRTDNEFSLNLWKNENIEGYNRCDLISSKFIGEPTMTLTKAQIVESIQNQTGFPKNRSLQIVESLLEIIKKTLESGEDVLVGGFGKFCVKERKERKGRNPATGDAMMLKPRKVVTFRCSGKWR